MKWPSTKQGFRMYKNMAVLQFWTLFSITIKILYQLTKCKKNTYFYNEFNFHFLLKIWITKTRINHWLNIHVKILHYRHPEISKMTTNSWTSLVVALRLCTDRKPSASKYVDTTFSFSLEWLRTLQSLISSKGLSSYF